MCFNAEMLHIMSFKTESKMQFKTYMKILMTVCVVYVVYIYK